MTEDRLKQGESTIGDTVNAGQRAGGIPEQRNVPWHVAFQVSVSSLRRRFLRSLVTMTGVILAIAFLSYMQVTNAITQALVVRNDGVLNVLLQRAGVDIFSETGTDRMMILLITLSLLACLVGIVNSMLMSVSERIKEIGTLKCLGALDSFIVRSYFIEASLQGLIGTCIGLLIGVVVAVAVAVVNYRAFAFSAFPPGPVLKSMLISFMVGAILSIFASILPAYMAAKKQPVDAMRVEE